ncbi:MAG: hypothetical protein RLZZ516_2077, partial [Cyanobacteriota bacterium]
MSGTLIAEDRTMRTGTIHRVTGETDVR